VTCQATVMSIHAGACKLEHVNRNQSAFSMPFGRKFIRSVVSREKETATT